MSWLQVIVLSVVQGLTEFLPISSSAHLAIVSRCSFSGDAGASHRGLPTRHRIGRAGLLRARHHPHPESVVRRSAGARAPQQPRLPVGWYVIIGSIPIAVLGYAFKHAIRSDVRNLWVIATAMLVFSAVIAAAEYFSRQDRHIDQLTWKDSIFVGVAQCLALIPAFPGPGQPSARAWSAD